MSTIFTLRPYANQSNLVLFHDYLCPWCYIGWVHARRLTEAYGVTFDWRGAELVPPEMEGYESKPGPRPIEPVDPSKPKTRFELFCETEGIALPVPRPGFVRTHRALLGAEWAKSQGEEAFNAYNDAIYRAYWEQCADIESLAVLVALANQAGLDGDALAVSVEEERFGENIIHFDDPIYAIGVRHVPTFLFGGEEQLAEAHYVELAYATQRFLARVNK